MVFLIESIEKMYALIKIQQSNKWNFLNYTKTVHDYTNKKYIEVKTNSVETIIKMILYESV